MQPPSGGCVLKRLGALAICLLDTAAAFGRLCVETGNGCYSQAAEVAAAFGRLCVETLVGKPLISSIAAAAFGRLCVETICLSIGIGLLLGSRLRAAVC